MWDTRNLTPPYKETQPLNLRFRAGSIFNFTYCTLNCAVKKSLIIIGVGKIFYIISAALIFCFKIFVIRIKYYMVVLVYIIIAFVAIFNTRHLILLNISASIYQIIFI